MECNSTTTCGSCTTPPRTGARPTTCADGVAYDDGGLGAGGTASLFVDGEQVASGRVEKTSAYVFSLDETSDVGLDSCSPVCDGYPPGRASAFTGEIKFIRIDLGEDSDDHLIDHEVKAQLAMTRQ